MIFWRFWGSVFFLAFVFTLLLTFYQMQKKEQKFQGLRLANYNHTSALRRAMDYEPRGDWVCVNIKGIDYKRALEVCAHEVGHEIFAEKCEKNFTKCMELMLQDEK